MAYYGLLRYIAAYYGILRLIMNNYGNLFPKKISLAICFQKKSLVFDFFI